MKFHNRYINNSLLKCISRPQDAYNCSLASLTAVINYLYFTDLREIQTMDMIADRLGFSSRIDFRITKGPTNEELMEWFIDFTKRMGLPGNVIKKYDHSTVYPYDSPENRYILNELEKDIQSRDRVLIYRSDNHYRPVCGFFECAEDPEMAFSDELSMEIWIILGDHARGGEAGRKPPVEAVRWGDVCKDFQNFYEGGTARCFLMFERI